MYVNGEQKTLQKEVSIHEFLEQERYDQRRIAVGKNGSIIPKTLFDTEILRDTDNLEIVSLIGGG
ncbi:MAG: sulfur carrier protein ThiS [Treponema sp.]|nr:sulfur carrier protein ThiS [Treponema sp.]